MLYYTLVGQDGRGATSMVQARRKSAWLDRAAVLLSALCLVHCLAVPLVVAGLPLLAQFTDSHLHAQMLLIVIPLSLAAFGLGYRHHRRITIILAGALGLFILILGATVVHALYGKTIDSIVTVSGSIVLAAAHFYNTRATRQPISA